MRSKHRLEFDQCRTFGHAWYEVDGEYAPLFGYLFSLRCERCGTTRNDIINERGELGSRNYRHPDGYKESEKLTRAEYRVRLINARPKKRTRKKAS